MDTSQEQVKYIQEINQEKDRLTEVFSELNDERLLANIKKSRLNIQGTREQLIDRLVRFDLRRLYGHQAALWDPIIDNDPKRIDQRASLAPDDLLLDDELSETSSNANNRNSQEQIVIKTHGQDTSTKSGSPSNIQPRTEMQQGGPGQPPLSFEQSGDYPHESNQETHPLPTRNSNNSCNSRNYPLPHMFIPPPPLTQFPAYNQYLTWLYSQPNPSLDNSSIANAQDALRAQGSISNNFPNFVATPFESTASADVRNNRVIDALNKWKIKFSGEPKEDIEEFLQRFTECREYYAFSEQDVLRAIPLIFVGPALHWARPIYKSWESMAECYEALRLQYGIPGLQLILQEEIKARTQGPEEPIAAYLSGIRMLMDKVVPKMTQQDQLDRTYWNLHPQYTKSIKRNQFNSFPQLQAMGQQEESQRERERNYRPPPSIEHSHWPNAACLTHQRKSRIAAIKTASPKLLEESEEVAAIVESSRYTQKSMQ